MPSLGSRPCRVTGRPGRQTLGVNIVSLHAREPRALVAGGAQLTGLEHALPRHVASGRMDPADTVSVRTAGSMVRARSLVGAAAVPRAIASVYCMRGSLAGLTELIENYVHSLILPNGMPTTSTTSGRPSMPNKRRKSARSCLSMLLFVKRIFSEWRALAIEAARTGSRKTSAGNGGMSHSTLSWSVTSTASARRAGNLAAASKARRSGNMQS
jgi:hypothetical protein